MNEVRSGLYVGTVVHKRLTPVRHAFAYRVFTLCLDVDEIDRLHSTLRFFSRNRLNLLSFWDADMADGRPEPVGDRARRLLQDAGLSRFSKRIELVCYPRVFGFVFNPLSVYFCHDESDRVGVVIYEVSNTFGERKSYIIEAANGQREGAVLAQSCAKELYVSPYTNPSGRYSFHLVSPAERMVIGVAFREQDEPVLKTHFSGTRMPLTDRSIVSALARHPLMTLKVVAAIHLEAGRLWAKRVPLVARHTSPPYSSTLVKTEVRAAPHA